MLQDPVQFSLQLLLVNKSWLCERQQTLEPPTPPHPLPCARWLWTHAAQGLRLRESVLLELHLYGKQEWGEEVRGREGAVGTCFTAPVKVPSPALYVLMVTWSLL